MSESTEEMGENVLSGICEFCGKPAPEDQYHPYWHDDGDPMVSCGACMAEEAPT